MSTTPVLTQRKARLQVDPSRAQNRCVPVVVLQVFNAALQIPGNPTDPNKFPDTWFQPVSTSTIIHRNDWNEVPSKHAKINGRVHFSVEWENPAGLWPFEDPLGRASQIGLLLKFYFGISGCVIPFGFSDCTLYAFTIAGPTALKGKKEMWKLALSSNISDVKLVKFKDLFASPADFHDYWLGAATEEIPPVPGGRDAYRKALEENCHDWHEDQSNPPNITSGELHTSDWDA